VTLGGPWRGHDGTSIGEIGEFGLISRLRSIAECDRLRGEPPNEMLLLGIGDDAASLRSRAGREILITCDTQVAGRHFVPDWITPRALGERCITVSASDIAAMGGLARAALVSLAVGPETAVEDLEDMYRGMTAKLDQYHAALIGGNVSGFDSGLVIDITLIGEIERGRSVRRNTAQPGDLVWVTGSPGSASAGFALLKALGTKDIPCGLQDLVSAYLTPTARLREGRALGLSGAVTSMIDLSDGLIGDIAHMVEGRRAGIVLSADSLPIGEPLARAAAYLGRTPDSFLLGPSDDYELIFTTTPESAQQALKALRNVSDVPAWHIGEVLDGEAGSVLIADAKGSRTPAIGYGWNHFPESSTP
jgi:thiamine-monophosphate kinase